MPAAAHERASERMVILLRPAEKERIQRLAKRERVSSAEIVRRSLNAYTEAGTSADAKLLAEMNSALDQALSSVRSARAEVQSTLAKVRKQRVKVA